mmetsp:Transcript_102572/g.320681  ORF Transcript_102572/g.320681 Transcript_102572/m.320681 type:complete len:217 (+) Transcript_102572:358-1008(+)
MGRAEVAEDEAIEKRRWHPATFASSHRAGPLRQPLGPLGSAAKLPRGVADDDRADRLVARGLLRQELHARLCLPPVRDEDERWTCRLLHPERELVRLLQADQCCTKAMEFTPNSTDTLDVLVFVASLVDPDQPPATFRALSRVRLCPPEPRQLRDRCLLEHAVAARCARAAALQSCPRRWGAQPPHARPTSSKEGTRPPASCPALGNTPTGTAQEA